MVQHWNRFPKEVMESRILGDSQNQTGQSVAQTVLADPA